MSPAKGIVKAVVVPILKLGTRESYAMANSRNFEPDNNIRF